MIPNRLTIVAFVVLHFAIFLGHCQGANVNRVKLKSTQEIPEKSFDPIGNMNKALEEFSSLLGPIQDNIDVKTIASKDTLGRSSNFMVKIVRLPFAPVNVLVNVFNGCQVITTEIKALLYRV